MLADTPYSSVPYTTVAVLCVCASGGAKQDISTGAALCCAMLCRAMQTSPLPRFAARGRLMQRVDCPLSC